MLLRALAVIGSVIWGAAGIAATNDQNLVTFNVSTETLQTISTLMEKSEVQASSEFDVLNADVMVFVIGSPKEITFLPQVLEGSGASEIPTEPFIVKVFDVTTSAGDSFQAIFVLGVRQLVPEMSDETFDCTTARLASAAMISRATGDVFQDVLKSLECPKPLA